MTEQKATGLIKYKLKTVVYYLKALQYNDISVIENNTFNNLPSLQNLRVSNIYCLRHISRSII